MINAHEEIKTQRHVETLNICLEIFAITEYSQYYKQLTLLIYVIFIVFIIYTD